VPETSAAPFDIEQPACFYLGREVDQATSAARADRPVMYDARDLTTHGVVVGMTGSGKTGLSIALLEEAAIDGIPCVLIDPKGDLTNLLLQFPGLDPARFEPWVNEDDARQKGLSIPAYAAELAARWRKGLEETGQPVDRVARLNASSEWRIYTPGSEAGLPLSILGTFAAPPADMPREALMRKVEATATALLGLSGITADPVQSREHILVSQLLLTAWQKGQDLDLAALIRQVENPPLRTVGAYSLETFFPAKERVRFAASLNNVLAAPGFASWTTGEPLDLARMLYRNGRPQQVIFYTAHLDDAQRMFFTTLLLEEVLSWTRKQPGTTNLRAILYFDEVYGYLPPHPANPPTKQPLMTLLKQARAFGVGILLATQNPVDLDYKALSNAGTWFVGKLQTERDKARLLDGLSAAAAEMGKPADRGQLERIIAGLSNRVFLLHDIHRGAPVIFQTRWAMSFLRGPLTREQVATLMEPVKKPRAVAAIPLCTWCHAELPPGTGDKCPNPACGKVPWARARDRVQDQQFRDALTRGATDTAEVQPSSVRVEAPVATLVPEKPSPAPPPAGDALPPVLPPDVKQFYLPAGTGATYRAKVLGFAEVVFVLDKRKGLEHRAAVRLLARPVPAGHPVVWEQAAAIGETLAPGPAPQSHWEGVPDSLDTGRKLKSLEKAFGEYLYSTQKLALFENRSLGLMSQPGETQEAFRERCRSAAADGARQALELEKAKFTPRFAAVGLSLPADAPEEKKGASLFSWLFGSTPAKVPPSAPTSRAGEKQRRLEGDYYSKRNEIREKWKRIGEEATAVQIKPRKADVRVTHFGLAWVAG
jgi:hypothetical protein